VSHEALQLKDLTFSYAEQKKVIDHISLSIAQGESIGIIGANGAGKSTLLLLLTGVLTADSGSITGFTFHRFPEQFSR